MTDHIVRELSTLVGADVIVRPDSGNLQRHLGDYGVRASADPGVLALSYPRDAQQVSKILRYCNGHRLAVQPQGGMTGLSGGAVPIGPCVVLSLERMRAIKEIDVAAGTITVEAGVVMETVQQAAVSQAPQCLYRSLQRGRLHRRPGLAAASALGFRFPTHRF